MSSIRRAQIERVLADVSRLLYSQGVKPTSSDIEGMASKYFSDNPPGLPLDFDINELVADGGRSDANTFNNYMLKVNSNLDVLYKVCMDQVEDVMKLNTEMREKLARLKKKRKEVEAKLDDQLMSLYNSDGYYFSVSDTFASTSNTDLDYTSSFVDTSVGSVTLPMVSRHSDRVKLASVGMAGLSGTVNGNTAIINELSPISNAFDGKTNTVWAAEIITHNKSEVVANFSLTLDGLHHITKIDVDPYGMSPAQWTTYTVGNQAVEPSVFGDSVKLTADTFTKRGDAKGVKSVNFTIRKTEPDYESHNDGVVTYRYIFGAKEISLIYQVYDNYATFVSKPLSVDGGAIVDAVSITTETDIPNGSSINFFVAEDNEQADSVDDFDWRKIVPVTNQNEPSTTVRFDGASRQIADITSNPNSGDLQKIDPDSVNPDLSLRNPTRSIIDGVDVYRLAQFNQKAIPGTIRLLEGVNTIRIHHQPFDTAAVESLDWWATRRNASQLVYSSIESGNSFFYGGNVGESARSVLLETFLDVPEKIETVMGMMKKSDDNSSTWDVKVFLNGNEIAKLDTNTSSRNVMWPFRQGLNHIAIAINIPSASTTVQFPYAGALDLINGSNLYDFGLVRLDEWSYIDFFDLEHNTSFSKPVFSVYNEEIVMRRKPTENFRLLYSTETGRGPKAVRLRADLTRDSYHSTVTPVLDGYRMRFSYSEA